MAKRRKRDKTTGKYLKKEETLNYIHKKVKALQKKKEQLDKDIMKWERLGQEKWIKEQKE